MSERRGFFETKRWIAGCALAALLGWQGVVAVLGIARAFRADTHDWRFRLTASIDERIRDALGPDDPAYRAVVEHVPHEAWLILNGDNDDHTLLLATQLIALLYPMRVVPRDVAVALAGEGRLRPTDPCYILELRAETPPYTELQVREVARGAHFVLFEQRIGG